METEKSNFSTADTKQLKKICCSEEEIIISLTTWSARINNLPVVLKSILEQTIKADKIIVMDNGKISGIGVGGRWIRRRC